MPFSIDGFNHKFESNRDYTPEKAIAILTRLAGHVGSKSGVLKLTHPAAPNEPSVFERKSWYQFHERSDANMEETSDLLKDLFSRAIARWPQADQGTFLGAINRYLRKHENRFETGALAGFVRSLNAHPSRAQAAQARVAGRTPQQAMTYLTNLKTQVSEKSGIMVADLDREQKTFAIDNRNWYDPYLEEDAERAASHLRKSFAEALGDQPEVKQAEFLSKIDDYLYSQYHKFGCNKFGTQAFNHFVNQLEELKIGVPAAPPNAPEAQPAAPLAEPIVQPSNEAKAHAGKAYVFTKFVSDEVVTDLEKMVNRWSAPSPASPTAQSAESSSSKAMPTGADLLLAKQRFRQACENLTPESAMEWLTELRSQMGAENGELTLGFDRQKNAMVFTIAAPSSDGSDRNKKLATECLGRLFWNALGGKPIEDSTPREREFLMKLDDALKSRDERFDVPKFVSYVDQITPELLAPDRKNGDKIVDRFLEEKVANWTPAEARKFLTEMKAQVRNQTGVLMLARGSTSESIVIKASWTASPADGNIVSRLLLGAFEKAFEDCAESPKNEILGPLRESLALGIGFIVKSFVSYVDDLEDLKKSLRIVQTFVNEKLLNKDKVKNWTPAEAREFLTEMKAQLRGESGDLMLDPGSTSERIVLKGNVVRSPDLNDEPIAVSRLLWYTFHRAFQDRPESQKKEIWGPLEEHFKIPGNGFPVEKFVSCVDQIENLKIGVPVVQPAEQITQPTRPVAGPITARLTGDGDINDRDAIKIGEMFVKEQVDNWTPADARKYLTDLKAKVRGESGDLMLAPGPTSDSLEIKGVEVARRGLKPEAFTASMVLEKAFEKALEDGTESQKNEILSRINNYLYSQHNWFDVKEFVSYVDQMENLKIGPEADPSNANGVS